MYLLLINGLLLESSREQNICVSAQQYHFLISFGYCLSQYGCQIDSIVRAVLNDPSLLTRSNKTGFDIIDLCLHLQSNPRRIPRIYSYLIRSPRIPEPKHMNVLALAHRSRPRQSRVIFSHPTNIHTSPPNLNLSVHTGVSLPPIATHHPPLLPSTAARNVARRWAPEDPYGSSLPRRRRSSARPLANLTPLPRILRPVLTSSSKSRCTTL